MKKTLRTGCCGYPKARAKYFKRYDIVEIQKTFYEPPKKMSTVERWREQAPPGFEFTLKAWQLITHPCSSPTYRKISRDIKAKDKDKYGFFRPTKQVLEAWDRISRMASILKARFIVFQCPASFKPEKKNIRNMEKFFKKIDRRDFRFAWEPRGDWQADTVKGLCRELDLVHCVDPFKDTSVYGRIKYYRLHGIGGYKYRYTSADLKKLRKICEKRRSAYIMFNNTEMWNDARRFERLL